MKKILTVIALLLCIGLLAGCGAQAVLHDVAEHLVNSRTDDAPPEAAETDDGPIAADGGAATASDAGETPDDGPAAGEAPASETDAGEQLPQSQIPEEEDRPAADFTSLSLEECVTDADGAEGQLPRIVLECPGADYINDDIEGTFRYLIGEDYCTLYYTASKNGPILSVMIAELYDGGSAYYNPYMLDLSTGEVMDGAELLSLLGLSSDELAETELRIMADEFEYQFGAMSQGESAAFYQEQYDRTVSPDNVQLNRLWLDDEGELNFVAKIYVIAGPELCEYPMGTGYFY